MPYRRKDTSRLQGLDAIPAKGNVKAAESGCHTGARIRQGCRVWMPYWRKDTSRLQGLDAIPARGYVKAAGSGHTRHNHHT